MQVQVQVEVQGFSRSLPCRRALISAEGGMGSIRTAYGNFRVQHHTKSVKTTKKKHER